MKSFVVVAFLALATAAGCQTTAQDFSRGFELLAGLGMPPLDAEAKWAKVVDPDMMDYQLRNHTKSIKGNGWIVRGKDGVVRHLPFGGMTGSEVEKGAKDPKPQDLEKDVEAIISAMRKAAEKADPDDMFGPSGHETFLLFAAQLHQTGRKELANRLAQAAFAFFPTRESAVDAAVDRIAEHFHQQTVEAFFKSGDWKAYHRELTALAGRFPRGWRNMEAVRMMLPQLARQANGEAASDPALAGVTLDPQALTIMRDMMRPPEPGAKQDAKNMDGMPPHIRQRLMMMQSMGHEYGGSGFQQPLWLISEADEDDKQPLARLAGLGMAAVPVLAALVNDPFFTHVPNSNSGSSYYSSRESDEERILRAYQSMSRPATRGEIATRMLALTLPDPENDLDEADAETLRDLAMGFWKTHRDASREDLAAAFLKGGSQQQASTAAEVLAASGNPEAHRIFETHVLAADSAIGLYSSVREYLKARKTAGKPFFGKYAELVRQQSAGASDDDRNEISWMIEREGGVDKILKQLEAIVEGESPRKMVMRIAGEDPKTAVASIRGLMESMSDADPSEQLTVLLTGAHSAKNKAVRAHLLGAISQLGWGANEDEDEEDGENDNVRGTPRQVSETEAEMWRYLIGDPRLLDASSRVYSMGNQLDTMSALACATFEFSVTGLEEFRELIDAMPVIARPAAQVITERAKARLEGKPVAPLPDPSKVSKERLAAIVAEAGNQPAAGLHDHLLTLNPDERAAWRAWLADPAEIPLPPTVSELRHQVVRRSISSPYGMSDMKDVGGIDVGFRVTVESVEQHIQSLAAGAAKHSRGVVAIQNAEFGPGLQVMAFMVPFPEPKGDEDASQYDPYGAVTADRVFRDAISFFESDADSEAVIYSEIQGSGSGPGVWTVKDGKATQKNPDDNDGGYLEGLRSALESTDNQRFYLTFRIITRADTEKINTNNE
jgi:hypothetical protein